MASGIINGTTSNASIASKIEWSSIATSATNSSSVTASLYYRRTNIYSGTPTSGTGSFSITIDGQVGSTSGKFEVPNSGAWAKALTVTKTVKHDDNGSKLVAISASGGIPVSSFKSTTCGETVRLDTIARASSITSAANVTLGNACNVVWTPQSASFHYKLRFSIGSWVGETGIISPNRTSSYSYTAYKIPMDVAYQIVNNPTGVMSVTLTTYSDSNGKNPVGSSEPKRFTVTVPISTAPKATMKLSPVHSLPAAFNDVYVQGLSKVKATISANPQYGASILNYYMNVGGYMYGENADYTSGYLTKSGVTPVEGYAVDSRTYGGKAGESINVIAYANPKILNVTAQRCDANGNPTDSGEYLKISATRDYYKVVSNGVQRNFCRIQYRYKSEDASYYSDWIPILDEDYLISDEVVTLPLLDGEFLSTKSYRVQVQVVDTIGNTATAEIIVPTDRVYWHRDGARNALGLGKYNERDNAIDSDWDFYMNGHKVTGLANPVDDTDAVSLGFLRQFIEQYLK